MKQTEYEWCYLFAATCPTTVASSVLLAARAGIDYMDRHLAFIAAEACEQAGRDPVVPKDITLLFLPPYGPEPDGHEIVASCLRQQYLSNRVFTDFRHLFEEVRAMWLSLTPDRLMSLTRTEWIRCAFQP